MFSAAHPITDIGKMPKAEVRALITITSSARPSKDSGMVMPSALAVEVNEQFDLCGLLHG